MPHLPYPLPGELPADVRDFLAGLPQHAAFDMLSWSAGTVRSFIEQGEAQYTALALPARTRELVIMTTGVATASEYEVIQHRPISEAAGVDPAVRAAILRRDFAAPELSEHDRAVVGFVAAVVAGPTVPDEIFAAVRRQLSNREIVEALQVTGFYWSFGRVCTVLDVDLEPDHGTAVVDASRRKVRTAAESSEPVQNR
jgi:alkylhydroperoxidase family enzyme